MAIKVFYDARQNVTGQDAYGPSAGKPAQVVESWKRLGIPLEFPSFPTLTLTEICLAHSQNYAEGVLSGRLCNGYGNADPAFALALPWVCGSAVGAALEAYRVGGITFSPTSGAHHAGYDWGGGYCTFNFLIMAARRALEEGARRVAILDLDQHFGDGTAHILAHLKLKGIDQFSYGAQPTLPGQSAEEWLHRLPKVIEQFRKPDLLLYNAGVDCHIDDPLGGAFTTRQLRIRDHVVLWACRRLGIPAAVFLAGGYQRDTLGTISPVLRLHDQTLQAAHAALTSPPITPRTTVEPTNHG